MIILSLAVVLFQGQVVNNSLKVWPNSVSNANSDEWISKNHNQIEQMRPTVLLLNFVNGLTSEKGLEKANSLIAALREASRYHGYENKDARPFLEYHIGTYVDLADREPLGEPLDGNSSKYPRVPGKSDGINFQYGRLFQKEFTEYYNLRDADRPSGKKLSLKELVDRGLVHEVWFLAKQGKFGAPFESIEVKQVYDAQFHKIAGKTVQAGNGGTPDQPFIGRSLKIVFINVDRGPGCAMESLGHSFEGMARSGAIPELKEPFEDYAGFNLDKKYGLPFSSLYGRSGATMDYPNPNSIEFVFSNKHIRNDNYIPVGGNVHFMPNGRQDYDLNNAQTVLHTMQHFRMFDGPNGKDAVTLFTSGATEQFKTLGSDCMGKWVIYWFQNMPGHGNRSLDPDGKPMRNWWVYLFY